MNKLKQIFKKHDKQSTKIDQIIQLRELKEKGLNATEVKINGVVNEQLRSALLNRAKDSDIMSLIFDATFTTPTTQNTYVNFKGKDMSLDSLQKSAKIGGKKITQDSFSPNQFQLGASGFDIQGTLLTTPNYGYGVYTQMQQSGLTQKYLNRKAYRLYGKGGYYDGGSTKRDKKDVALLNETWDEYGLDQILIKFSIMTEIFGGAFIVPQIPSWSDKKWQSPFEYTPEYIKKGSIKGYSVSTPPRTNYLFVNTMYPTKEYYQEPWSYISQGKVIHASRLIKMVTMQLDEQLAPTYMYNGISGIQLTMKSIFNSTFINNILVQTMAQNSFFVYKTSQISNNNILDEEAERIAAQRDNNTSIITIKNNEEMTVCTVNMNVYEKIWQSSLEYLCMLTDDDFNAWISDTGGGKLNSKDGSQDMINWHNFSDFFRVKQGYNSAHMSLRKLHMLNVLGKINHNIKVVQIPRDSLYYKQQMETALIEVNVLNATKQLLMNKQDGLGNTVADDIAMGGNKSNKQDNKTKPKSTQDSVNLEKMVKEQFVKDMQEEEQLNIMAKKCLAQSPVNPLNTEMQEHILNIETENNYKVTNPNAKISK